MSEYKIIEQELINILRNQKTYKVYLFGSNSYGKVHDDSDIDLIIILNKYGISDNYKTILENKKIISKQLRELRKRIPIDILVYTKDEWEIMKSSESSFINQIQKQSIQLI
jgi:uncharacterized protein